MDDYPLPDDYPPSDPSTAMILAGTDRGTPMLPVRLPPHNDEAEMALLGAILHNNRAFERVIEFLRPEHFANRIHGKIFEAVGKLIDRGQIADPITLKQYFESNRDLTEIGGFQYLMTLAGSLVSVINAEDYGRVIHELFVRRQLIEIGEEAVNLAFNPLPDQSAHTQIELVEQQLFNLATVGDIETGFQPFHQAITASLRMAEAAYRRDGKLAGVPSGLRDLDRLLGGLHNSDLLILAARPSMGKTALATNIAYNAARVVKDPETQRKHSVAFFSLEMSSEQLATRVLSDVAQIQSHRIQRGDLQPDDFERLVIASQQLERLSLYIDDTPALSITSVRTRARRLKRQSGLDLIVVDYLQLLRGTDRSSSDNRVQEVSEITRGLKAIAKELDVPVIALSQLSRQVENREDKRPQLSDLRESGSIEQDADVVMFIYREEYYLARKEPAEGTAEHDAWKAEMERYHNRAEIIIAKQRHGPIGRVVVHFDGNTTRFSDLAEAEHLPEDY
ncbi:MAG: replicative DNA helicase [Elstera sp.]